MYNFNMKSLAARRALAQGCQALRYLYTPVEGLRIRTHAKPLRIVPIVYCAAFKLQRVRSSGMAPGRLDPARNTAITSHNNVEP